MATERRTFSIGLKQLLLGAGGGILLCCAVVAVHFLEEAQNIQREAQAEAEQLARYEVVLRMVSAISAERGPANNAMTGEGPAVVAALHKKRAQTDAELAELAGAFRAELAPGGAHFGDLALLTAQLRSARSAVDLVVALPPGKRNPDDVSAAVHALFRSADAAFAFRDKLGSEIVAGTRNLPPQSFC